MVRPLRVRPRVRVLQLVTGALVVAYLASTLLRRRDTTSILWDGWVGNLGYAGCAALCLWRAINERAERWAWATIGLSLTLFTAGAVMWTTTVQFMDPVPYPSLADVCFLVFYPVAYVGVGLLVRSSLAHSSSGVWFDGLIATLGIAALEATLVIGPVSRGSHGSTATVLTNIAYPVGDLVLVVMVVGAFALHGWRPGGMWWTLGVGLVVFAAADSIYVLRVSAGNYFTGTPLDSLWLIGAFFIATAAWQNRRRAAPQTGPIAAPAFVSAVFLLISLGIIVYATTRSVLPVGVVLATGTLLVAITRVGWSYRQLHALAESRREARTDELTNLVNRRFFYASVEEHLVHAPNDSAHALFMIDLDRFKEINDSLGHHVGDEVLALLGPRLEELVGPLGTLARLGGDEFGFFLCSPLADAVEDTAVGVARTITEALERPFHVAGMALRVDASTGIAIAPQHGSDAATLLQKADVAMYEAKRARRQVAIYSAERDIHTRDRLELIEELRDAIEAGELLAYYQPKLDLSTNSIVGVEALVRWEHPARGLLGPDRFLGLVEKAGLMGRLTEVVLEQALSQLRQWRLEGLDLTVAVNLSPSNVLDDHLPAMVADLAAAHGIDADRLVFEITEDSILTEPEQVGRVLAELRRLGVGVSVDDYGTGFSSLSYLRELPIDELKLDRSFLTNTEDPRAVSIVRSTIELAHALGLRIVAEGVETQEWLELLGTLDCDVAQGFHIGRPAPAEELRFGLAVARPA